jgi:hypothetical protein
VIEDAARRLREPPSLRANEASPLKARPDRRGFLVGGELAPFGIGERSVEVGFLLGRKRIRRCSQPASCIRMRASSSCRASGRVDILATAFSKSWVIALARCFTFEF